MKAFFIYIGFIVCMIIAATLLLGIIILIISKIEDLIIDHKYKNGKRTNLTIKIDRDKRFK